jgi:hypothetical protein
VTPIICPEQNCVELDAEGACSFAASQLGIAQRSVLEARIPASSALDPLPMSTTITVASGGAEFTVTSYFGDLDVPTIDWSATTGVDIVIVKAGLTGNAYTYSPEATSDTVLTAEATFEPLNHVVFCFDADGVPSLSVTKTASPAFKRTQLWAIAKSSPTSAVTLAPGAVGDPCPSQSCLEAAYVVTVAPTGHLDAEWAVTGTITVVNSTSTAATGVDVVDSYVVDSYAGVAATIDCPTFGLGGTLAAGDSFTCTYTVAPGGAFDGTNLATVTTTGAVTGATASAPVSFAEAVPFEVDGCVSVTDSRAGSLGVVCAAQAPGVFSYSLRVGPYAACDPTGAGTAFSNTASFAAPSGASGAATWTIHVQLPCPSNGCTLTQGYWKTHSREGPAPYDRRWGNIGPEEEDTAFFLSDQTWLEVFRTPVRGNPYYSLAHQYMAAKLNVLAGADASAIGSALSMAEAFFSAKTPSSSLSAKARAELLALAALLDDFNSGRIGPGHCDDSGDGSGGDGGDCSDGEHEDHDTDGDPGEKGRGAHDGKRLQHRR